MTIPFDGRIYDLMETETTTYIVCVLCRSIIFDPKEHDRLHEEESHVR